ncbi:MAG: hypothetical protein HKN39_04170 [Flavobacteriales bacterium]|nr:hypothetical protein [Flavobacteriales bacterium]
MKYFSSLFILAILMVACQPPVDNSAQEAFAKNSATVLKYLEDFQNESIDYDAIFAADCVFRGTSFGVPDSTSLDQVKETNANRFPNFDYKLLTDPVLLPGVKVETKEMDGSVRYYGDWEVTRLATDSTEARTGVIKSYSSYDFDADGKIVYSQFYGDVGGLVDYLFDDDDEDDEEGDDD